MQPFFAEALPPHLDFETRSLEKRRLAPPDGDGSVYYDQVDFVIITPAGSKDKIERIWSEYEPYITKLSKDNQFPRKWLDEYRLAYKEWKAGNELPLTGTPIRNWPVLTTNEVKILIRANIRTVEELAQANEAALQQVGMGARSMQQRARDWITAKAGDGGLVATMDAMRASNEALEQKLVATNALVADLQARLNARPQPVGEQDWAPAPRTQREPDERQLDKGIDDVLADFTRGDQRADLEDERL